MNKLKGVVDGLNQIKGNPTNDIFGRDVEKEVDPGLHDMLLLSSLFTVKLERRPEIDDQRHLPQAGEIGNKKSDVTSQPNRPMNVDQGQVNPSKAMLPNSAQATPGPEFKPPFQRQNANEYLLSRMRQNDRNIRKTSSNLSSVSYGKVTKTSSTRQEKNSGKLWKNKASRKIKRRMSEVEVDQYTLEDCWQKSLKKDRSNMPEDE